MKDAELALCIMERQRGIEKIISAGTEIMSTPPASEDMGFLHSTLCQVGLPRSKIEGREFLRKSGSAWLFVQAGLLDEGFGPVWQPVPYGSLARLALIWISTRAVQSRSREIFIGKSASDFLRILGMGSDGRRHAMLRQQINALAACRLQVGYREETHNITPFSAFHIWQDKCENQQSQWPGILTLSSDYFSEIKNNNSVPLDLRAVRALKGSALALDIYTWLAQRLHRIEGKPILLRWKSIRDQFGQEYDGKNPAKDFKKDFLRALKKVAFAYPKARVRVVTTGLFLQSSPPPIPFKHCG